MTSPVLHIIGIDPGATTGLAVITVPRLSLFGSEPPEILEWKTEEIHGSEDDQAVKIARRVREVQSLSYKIGPAVVCEDFDFGSPLKDKHVYSPVRIAAKLKLLNHLGMMGDARFFLQSRTMAKTTITDERLRYYGMWVPGPDHQRDSLKHALTALRRAKEKRAVRERMWDVHFAAAQQSSFRLDAPVGPVEKLQNSAPRPSAPRPRRKATVRR